MNEVIYHIEAGTNPNRRGDLLHVAAKEGHVDLVRFFIGKGLNVNGTNPFTCGSTDTLTIHFSAKHGHLETVKCLVEHKANIYCKDRAERTPFFLSAGEGNLDIVQFLIENGADYTFAKVIGMAVQHHFWQQLSVVTLKSPNIS